MLNLVFNKMGVRDRLASAYAINYIRMVDKAVREYEQARRELLPFVENRESLLALIRTADHLETCVNAVKRALNNLDRMRQHKQSAAVPRTFWRALRHRESVLRNIRKLVEHMDNALSTGEVVSGQPTAVSITDRGDAARIGEHTRPFSELAATIRKLYEWASDLAQYRETTVAQEQSGT